MQSHPLTEPRNPAAIKAMSGQCRPDVGLLSCIWRGAGAVDAPWSYIPKTHNTAHEVFHGYIVKYTCMGMVFVTFFNHKRGFRAQTQRNTVEQAFYYPAIISGCGCLPFERFCFLSCRPGLCPFINAFLPYPNLVVMEGSC